MSTTYCCRFIAVLTVIGNPTIWRDKEMNLPLLHQVNTPLWSSYSIIYFKTMRKLRAISIYPSMLVIRARPVLTHCPNRLMYRQWIEQFSSNIKRHITMPNFTLQFERNCKARQTPNTVLSLVRPDTVQRFASQNRPIAVSRWIAPVQSFRYDLPNDKSSPIYANIMMHRLANDSTKWTKHRDKLYNACHAASRSIGRDQVTSQVGALRSTLQSRLLPKQKKRSAWKMLLSYVWTTGLGYLNGRPRLQHNENTETDEKS